MILTLEQLKQEVGRHDDYHDELLQLKLTLAESIVIDYLKPADPNVYGGPGINDFPDVIAAGVLLIARALYETPENDPLTPAVKSILKGSRDPALA